MAYHPRIFVASKREVLFFFQLQWHYAFFFVYWLILANCAFAQIFLQSWLVNYVLK